MADHRELIAFYRNYATTFAAEEPAYAEVCRRLGEHPELVALIAAHAADARQPNLLFAAVHYLLLGGLDHPLAAVYASTSTADPVPLFADLVLANRAAIDDLLATRRTQTNEVGRSAVLALVLNDAQRRSARPLAWVDLGASGGLNLNCDRFRIDYGLDGVNVVTGSDAASVRLRCQVRGGNPRIEPVHAEVSWRLGIDRAPIDITDPDEARWLHACLWPGMVERHDRLRAAIAVAHEFEPPMIAADAAAGIARALELAPDDTTLVMTTTWVWYYLPEQTRCAVLAALQRDGRPVLWYSLEGTGVVEELGIGTTIDVDNSVVGLVELGGTEKPTAGNRVTIFGASHPHGTWIDWSWRH